MVYQICKRCILDSNIPDISFNNGGICNFCDAYLRQEQLKPQKDAETLEKEFLKIVSEDSDKFQYDCLCLYSGGKDSTNMLYNLVDKLKLRVLAFTLDNWFLSQETYGNIKKVVTHLGVDHMFYKPDWDTVSYLFKLGVKGSDKNKDVRKMSFLVGYVCWPCFVMISIFSIKTALEKNIPNIVVGTTPGQLTQKTEDLLTKYRGIPDVYQSMIKPFISIADKPYKKKLGLTLFGKIKSLSLKLVPFYEYFKYNEEAAFKVAEDNFSWVKPNDTDSCSTNCLINALGIAIHRRHHKISPYLIPLAYDVRAGLVKREDALKAVNASVNERIVKEVAQKLNLCDEI